MRPLRLTLTGFRGIWSGMGMKTLDLDLSSDSGLVALVGDNGRGKSTILQNLHPYRLMPDRVKTYTPKSFSFYDETFGSDARKDLVFRTEEGLFRGVLVIDAVRRRQEAYLYRQEEGGSWAVYGNTQDGKLDAYDQAIEKLVGSARLFFTSVFRCQKAPSLSSYTRGEMIDIFSELIMVDDLRQKEETALMVAEALAQRKGVQALEKARLDAIIRDEPVKQSEAARINTRLSEIAGQAEALTRELAGADERLNVLRVSASLQAEAANKKVRIAADLRTKQKQMQDLDAGVRERRKHYHERLTARKQRQEELVKLAGRLPELRQLSTDEAELIAEMSAVRDAARMSEEELISLSRQIAEYAAMETRKKEIEKDLQKIRLDRQHAVSTAEKELARAERSAGKLQDVPCADMQLARDCHFVRDAVKDREALEDLRKAVVTAAKPDAREAQLEDELAQVSEWSEGKALVEASQREANQRRTSLAARLQMLEKELQALQERLKLLPQAEEAERLAQEAEAETAAIMKEGGQHIEAMERQIMDLAAEIASLEAESASIEIDLSIQERISAASGDIEKRRADIEGLRKEESSLAMQAGAAAEALKGICLAKEALGGISAAISELDREISEWQLLAKAMEGVITLEIDDAGPTVTAITNDILHSCYGSRFSVNIRTQDVKANGRDLKEVFDIIVYDSERDESKSLALMSGGEETWIDDAITRGISLFNASRGGRRFHVLFSDEKDGRLTEARRKEFMDVKRKVLDLGGFDCEYFISHTREVQEMADGEINLNAIADAPSVPDAHAEELPQEALL